MVLAVINRWAARRLATHTTSTMALPYALEKQVAIAAVRRACVLTSSVFNQLVKGETLTKDDKSPVTGLYPAPQFLM